MRKLIAASIAAASLLTAATAANAGQMIYNGFGWVYVPSCFFNYYGAYVCG